MSKHPKYCDICGKLLLIQNISIGRYDVHTGKKLTAEYTYCPTLEEGHFMMSLIPTRMSGIYNRTSSIPTDILKTLRARGDNA